MSLLVCSVSSLQFKVQALRHYSSFLLCHLLCSDIMYPNLLEPEAPHKLFLLQVALVTQVYDSERNVTDTVAFTYNPSTYRLRSEGCLEFNLARTTHLSEKQTIPARGDSAHF